jgi:hypothetical protein
MASPDTTMNTPPDTGALTDRLVDQFLELPSLRLTNSQAARLLGVDCGVSEQVLQDMLDAAFLRRLADGTVMRADR